MSFDFRTSLAASIGNAPIARRAVIASFAVVLCGATAFAQGTTTDFNGDGVADLAVGAPGANGGKGAVAIYLGVPGVGFASATPALILNSQAVENYGAAVAAADFDGDGRSELVIGAPSYYESRGRVEIIRFLPINTVDLIPESLSLRQGNRVAGAEKAGNRFGASLATGHFDTDRLEDLAVGAPGYDVGTKVDTGAVNVFYGGSRIVNLDRDQLWTLDNSALDTPTVNETARAGDLFGHALASGDFNGDGWDDLAIGVPYRDLPFTTNNEGSVSVIYGTPSGLSGNGYQVVNFISPERGGDLLGFSLAAGDFDRDGRSDLAIGAPYGNYPGTPSFGYVLIEYGTPEGLDSMYFAPRESSLRQAGALIGWSLAAADYTGDGYDDLAIGAPAYDVDGVPNAGAVMILYGGERYYFDPAHVFHQNSSGVLDRPELGDWFGTALTTGDYDADGLADLAIGIQYEDRESTTTTVDAGAVAVLTGAPTVLSSSPNFFLRPIVQGTARFGAALGR